MPYVLSVFFRRARKLTDFAEHGVPYLNTASSRVRWDSYSWSLIRGGISCGFKNLLPVRDGMARSPDFAPFDIRACRCKSFCRMLISICLYIS